MCACRVKRYNDAMMGVSDDGVQVGPRLRVIKHAETCKYSLEVI